MMMRIFFLKITDFLIVPWIFVACLVQTPVAHAAVKQAQYANLSYDVAYVRCPRGKPDVLNPHDGTSKLINWKGVNDLWFSAFNNLYHQPGCDLVIHHSDPAYGGSLPQGHPAREEVLVNCDEDNVASAVCTIADPNVSYDARYIVYTKILDTRSFTTTSDMKAGGTAYQEHSQSVMLAYPNGDGPASQFLNYQSGGIRPYDSPALVYLYDLAEKKEIQVSPDTNFLGGTARPWMADPDDKPFNVSVMDTGPFFLPDGRIGFTSNRASASTQFQLFAMDRDGQNLTLLGHRAIGNQLHPATLKDGRVVYTNFDSMLQKSSNNQFSLFTINADGSDPFIFAGKLDSTQHSYHYVTQLSDGDVVSTIYYNHNNTGLGMLLRFPVDPPGPDFVHMVGAGIDNRSETVAPLPVWTAGTKLLPFARKGQFVLTPNTSAGDIQMSKYALAADYWMHPSRSEAGVALVVNGQTFMVDQALVTMEGKFSHPSAAPDNDLLVAYTIGGSSTMPHADFWTSLGASIEIMGKDAGVWMLPLEPNSTKQIGHIADSGLIVVDFPEYHEIMPRAVVAYSEIYGQSTPDNKPAIKNNGTADARLQAGEPFGLSGAASLYDRETQSLNGLPWNTGGGGAMAGRTYTNLAASGADLAIFDNAEISGVRVLLPIPPKPNKYNGGVESWAGAQKHPLRILGEFPVRKPDGTPLDLQGNPDTSFVLKLPADTPFLFQTIDKYGMALDIETASRSLAAGEQQFCGGCHVHTREGMDPFDSLAKKDVAAPYGDFSGNSAPLFNGLDGSGNPTVSAASDIYTGLTAVNNRKSFAVEWENGIKQIIDSRCASCHTAGQPGYDVGGLSLAADNATYKNLVGSRYGKCCTASRWVGLNSARSSMLIWALYGERMDGRDPVTGLPPVGSGVPVDTTNSDKPEVWPNVADHLAYVGGMPESEKRLLARWIDIGAPKANIHDDMMGPVVTITPVDDGGVINKVLLGVWDDSPIDYARLRVSHNGSVILNGSDIVGTPSVIEVVLPSGVTDANAGDHAFEFEVWDKPNRDYSVVMPGAQAANRIRQVISGVGLLKGIGVKKNSAPISAKALITAYKDNEANIVPIVHDPDASDTHYFTIVSQPADGSARVQNNRLVYVPNSGYFGDDSFKFSASDLSGSSVTGTALVTVLNESPPVIEIPQPIITPDPIVNPVQQSPVNNNSQGVVGLNPKVNSPRTEVVDGDISKNTNSSIIIVSHDLAIRENDKSGKDPLYIKLNESSMGAIGLIEGFFLMLMVVFYRRLIIPTSYAGSSLLDK